MCVTNVLNTIARRWVENLKTKKHSNNAGSDCLGAGVRLGGREVDGFQYGVGNSVSYFALPVVGDIEGQR